QREATHLADLPDAAVLDEAVAEDRHLPPALFLIRLAQHAELDAARPGLVAASKHIDGHVELDAVVELSVLEPGRPHALHPPAHACRPAPHALTADFDDTLAREQVHHVVPHLAVFVEAVRRLQTAD